MLLSNQITLSKLISEFFLNFLEHLTIDFNVLLILCILIINKRIIGFSRRNFKIKFREDFSISLNG